MVKLIVLFSTCLLLMNACSGSCPSAAGAKTALQPMMVTAFEVIHVQASPEIPGFCETVVMMNKQPVVLYLDKKGKFVVSGSIFDIATKKNLTSARLQEVKK